MANVVRRVSMDRSVREARWILGPVFGLCGLVAVLGIFAG
jgi:hypothetical protein